MKATHYIFGAGLVAILIAAGFMGSTQVGVQIDGMSFKADWLACNDDRDCTTITYGCGARAPSNQASVDAVKEMVYAERGNPMTISCSLKQDVSKFDSLVICKNAQCALISTPQ